MVRNRIIFPLVMVLLFGGIFFAKPGTASAIAINPIPLSPNSAIIPSIQPGGAQHNPNNSFPIVMSPLAQCTGTSDAGNAQDASFFTDVLGQMGISSSPFAINAFAQWEGDENTDACSNPIATTYQVAWFPSGTGCTESIFNGANVRNYSSKYCGEIATSRTLLYTTACGSDCYKPIRDMLSLSNFDYNAILGAVSTWNGSGGYTSSLVTYWQSIWPANGSSFTQTHHLKYMLMR